MDGENLPVVIDSKHDLVMTRTPSAVLAEAQTAAKELTAIIAKKAKPVVFGGEQYLEFEDWQTIAKFYGLTAKVLSTEFVTYGDAHGFAAKASAFHLASGQEISSAEGLCLSDERNWAGKPYYQLKSMAQTRACAKALRNVLSWVAVLGGYKPTPAEEMDDATVPLRKPPSAAPTSGDLVTEIESMLANMHDADTKAMQAHLKDLTKWNDKETHQEKWVELANLDRIAKAKPDWLKRIHGRVSEAYEQWKTGA